MKGNPVVGACAALVIVVSCGGGGGGGNNTGPSDAIMQLAFDYQTQ